jgi:hypothetical protein
MNQPMPEDALAEIEHRMNQVFTVAPPPWRAGLETREGLGGESFVQFLGDPDADNEMYRW